MAEAITNLDDIIDSRDVIERIEELEAELEEAFQERSEVRKIELADELEDARIDRNDAALEVDEGAVPLVDFPEFVNLVAADPEHPLHKEALEFTRMNNGTLFSTLDEFVEETSADPRHLMYDEATEYKALRGLEEQAEGCGDWKYGAQLIRESYFKDYAQLLAEDIGAVNADATWPNNCIDWDQAARELEVDYTRVDFDGVDFLFRS